MDGVVIGREKGEGLIDACEINASLLTVLTVIVNPFLYRRTIRGSFVEARWKHGTRPVSFFFFSSTWSKERQWWYIEIRNDVCTPR